MVVAGVLIKTEPGKTKAVLRALRKEKGIKYAYAVFGRYDIIATITEAKSLDDVAKIIAEKVGSLDGVRNTETLIVANI